MSVLSNLAKLLLLTFPTTVEEDLKLLASTTAADEQLALRFRIDKKNILVHAVTRISKRLKVGAGVAGDYYV